MKIKCMILRNYFKNHLLRVGLFYNHWKWKQWKEPIRFLYRGSGLVIWKWCGVEFPTWDIFLGDFCHFGYSINKVKARFYLHIKSSI